MQRESALQSVCFVVLLLAIVVRGIMPAGFMAAPSSNGFSLTICSGAATKTIFVADQTNPSGPHEQTIHETCPFAPPVLADNVNYFNISDYLTVNYASLLLPSYPDSIAIGDFEKSFYAQGPPKNFVV